MLANIETILYVVSALRSLIISKDITLDKNRLGNKHIV